MPDTNQATSHLDQLRDMTVIVADTGDIEAIRKAEPIDATTNPSLILKAAKVESYAPLIAEAIAATERSGKSEAQIIDDAIDRITVRFGSEILSIIPGRVSVEVDARLSYDTTAIVSKAQKLIGLFADAGIGPDRVLIKTAATWEGIRAAEILEGEGINCKHHPAFRLRASPCQCRGGRFSDLALRWTHPRLVQEDQSGCDLHRRKRSRRRLGHRDLSLLQRPRIPHGRHGRQFPQC